MGIWQWDISFAYFIALASTPFLAKSGFSLLCAPLIALICTSSFLVVVVCFDQKYIMHNYLYYTYIHLPFSSIIASSFSLQLSWLGIQSLNFFSCLFDFPLNLVTTFWESWVDVRSNSVAFFLWIRGGNATLSTLFVNSTWPLSCIGIGSIARVHNSTHNVLLKGVHI